MKKILSVALSTAMAFSMFASVAFGADAKLTPEQQFNALKEAGIVSGFPDGLSHLERTLTRAELAKIIVNSLSLEPVDATSYNDKNYANHWGRPYIEAATQAGILNGKDAVKKLFDPNGAVTVQELAKVLVTALKLEVPADANNTASEWAKGYVAAAVNAGYLADGINYQAQATRSQAVVAAYAIYEAAQVPTVKSYNVVDSKNVEFTLSNGEVVKVALETALEPNKATEVTFKTADGKEIKTSVTWVVTTATKVEKVATDNLKEVTVTFDGEVDKATAELRNNYTLNANLKIKSAVLNDAKNAVVLTLEEDQKFNNQQKYSLTVSGVKAGDKIISASNVEFTPVDNTLPEVVSVTGLGTKAIKVVFSEPVKSSFTGSFQLNGQGFYGSPSIEDRELILRSSSDLPVGEHTLTVSGVEDFAGFKSLSSSHKFTVAEDKTAPTIAEATATLEKLTVTFSEDIDDTTLSLSNVYHKRGDSKINPERYVKVAGNKYEFYFATGDALPSYETAIFVEGVKDYSGNQITETSKLVSPKIDTERPTVIDTRVSATDKKKLILTFSKDIAPDQKWADLITVKDKDGKLLQFDNVNFGNTNNILEVNFFKDLPEGTNTLSIKGLKDRTVLGNVMLDYTTTFSVGDKTAPKFSSVAFTINDSVRRAVIVFNEKMDAASLVVRENYVLDINGTPTALPSDAVLTVTQDSHAVVIELPVRIDGTDITSSSWKGVSVRGVKDVAGNYLENFTKDIAFAEHQSLVLGDYDGGKNAGLSGKREIKVKLSQAVSRVVNKNSVSVNVAGVTDVVANSSETITIKLDKDIYTTEGLEVTFDETKFISVAQGEIGLATLATATTPDTVVIDGTDIKDEVAPEVKGDQSRYAVTSVTGSTYTVRIYVTENLKNAPQYVALAAQDLTVTRYDNKTVPAHTTQSDFYFEVSDIVDAAGTTPAYIEVQIVDANGRPDGYTIEVKDNAKILQDEAGNAIKTKGAVRTIDAR
jgi:hypothetical protein